MALPEKRLRDTTEKVTQDLPEIPQYSPPASMSPAAVSSAVEKYSRAMAEWWTQSKRLLIRSEERIIDRTTPTT